MAADETFDIEAVYDSQIAPLMTQIIAICREHRMPVLASFQFADTKENGLSFCTTHLHFEGRRPEAFAKAVRIIRRGDALFAAFTITSKDPAAPEQP